MTAVTPSPTAAIVDAFLASATELATLLAANPGRLPLAECVKIAAAMATMNAVYSSSCDGGV